MWEKHGSVPEIYASEHLVNTLVHLPFKDAAYRTQRGKVTHARSQSKCAPGPRADPGSMLFFNLIVSHCPKIVWILQRYYFPVWFSPLLDIFEHWGRCVEKISYPIPTPAHQQSLIELTANTNFLSSFSALKSHFPLYVSICFLSLCDV